MKIGKSAKKDGNSVKRIVVKRTTFCKITDYGKAIEMHCDDEPMFFNELNSIITHSKGSYNDETNSWSFNGIWTKTICDLACDYFDEVLFEDLDLKMTFLKKK